jgi:hypothetical protein
MQCVLWVQWFCHRWKDLCEVCIFNPLSEICNFFTAMMSHLYPVSANVSSGMWKESGSWGVWIVRTHFQYRCTSKALLIYIGFEVLTMVVMKSSLFWDIALCSPLIDDCHGGTCCLHLHGQRWSQKTCSYEMLVDCQTRQRYVLIDMTLHCWFRLGVL